MAFITKSNLKKIIYKSEICKLDLREQLYRIPIYFFSKYEVNELLAIQELLKNPEKYFNEIYVPYTPVDTYKYVYEGGSPAFHFDYGCEGLHSEFTNYEIPGDIVEKGKEKVIEFRKWFKIVEHLLTKDPEAFVAQLALRWGIETNPRAIISNNTGVENFENFKIEDLIEKIDKKIKEASCFYYQNQKNTAILKQYSKFTFLVGNYDPLRNNCTGYTDNEVRELLGIYEKEFKAPLKAMLVEYYRLKHNPEIEMHGPILQKIGFKACGYCCHNQQFLIKELVLADLI